MVVGDENSTGEGGRYGSVGDSPASKMEGGTLSGGGGDGRSSSSSSVIIDDSDDGGLMAHDVYQRQPLLPSHSNR